ncbi:MAG: Rpn family recombination-promoting nuclease/putative transposase [Akkermansiaceae bacterium]|nr:Rpn family recombination-promoting nuclease/putative transposase [Akkermansiaceae bacterium]MCF7732687.1 Rpn family recombination-promoting nuclease/putative transposase [Akkermansiaceae bacterium]
MAHFLDPRSDIVFKRIFGEHPEILRDFLNGVLPFEDESEFITSLEYLSSEQVPDIPLIKNSIVDVRCKDAAGRQFIVEMQMAWTTAFLQRVLFNASKAYVRQLEKGEQYERLCPVIGLSLLDATYDPDPDNYYHDYRIVETGNPERVLEGLRLVFVELPKYRETRPQEARKLRWAWLRFLKEAGGAGSHGHPTVDEFRREVGLNDPLLQALDIAEECGFSPAQLERYDVFWDAVSRERTLISGKYAEGRAEGRAEGLAEGEIKGLLKAATSMKAAEMAPEIIAQTTGLSLEQISQL